LLASVLHDCRALRELDLQDNAIGSEGAHRLEMLRGDVSVLVDAEYRECRWRWVSWDVSHPVLLRLYARYAPRLS
jgi:hypothetical protein